jgi:hypothetical protein
LRVRDRDDEEIRRAADDYNALDLGEDTEYIVSGSSKAPRQVGEPAALPG